MTSDFIEDAMDALEKTRPEFAFVMIAAHFGSPTAHRCANVPTREGLEWMKKQFASMCEDLEEQYRQSGQ